MFKRALRSTKFQATLAGLIALVIVAIVNKQQIDPNVLSTLITALIASYVGATAYEDSQQAKAQATVNVAAVAASQPAPPTLTIDTNNVNVTTENKS